MTCAQFGTRKGPALKRSRSKRSYVETRQTGIRVVDDLLKTSAQPIRDGTDLRDDVRVSLSGLMEACHLPQTSSVKQCLRSLHTRLQQCDGASLSVSIHDNVRVDFLSLFLNLTLYCDWVIDLRAPV